MNNRSVAFGAPGIEPRWTSSAEDGIGTAYHSSACVWFTLSHGIINEIYFPHVDTPNTRDLQFLITDGETFCHEEKRDLEMENSGIGCWFGDLPSDQLPADAQIDFTFLWREEWEGNYFQVKVAEPHPTGNRD